MGSGMKFSYELSIEHNGFEGLTVWDRMGDGQPAGWRVNADDGFVMYDPTEEVPSTIDPATGEETPGEIYYSRVRYLPRNYDWSKFGLVAVEEGVT